MRCEVSHEESSEHGYVCKEKEQRRQQQIHPVNYAI